MVSKAVYEGQRETTEEKRVCILTRSAFLGQQRYGVINWSGDIGGDWDTYHRQIVAGLNFTITGLPYWTTDIGFFSVRVAYNIPTRNTMNCYYAGSSGVFSTRFSGCMAT
jgi:alpha-glucosidase (family GH31 glycosyl hydrolase)